MTTPAPTPATARRGSLYHFHVDNAASLLMSYTTDDRARLGPARVRDLRPADHRRHPPRRRNRHLRHPRLGRQAAASPLRRPAVPRRVDVALPAGGLPRALRHRRRPRRPTRQTSSAPGHPGHHRRHVVRRAVWPRQGGARPRCQRGRHVDHHRRRRHDTGGARAEQVPCLPIPSVALRDEPRRPAQGRRDRGRARPGRQARRRRHAARAEDLRRASQGCAPCPRASTSARPAGTRTGPDPTTSPSRSTSCARSPTGRSRSTSRSARPAPTTT